LRGGRASHINPLPAIDRKQDLMTSPPQVTAKALTALLMVFDQ
jgi:hypothetical protein